MKQRRDKDEGTGVKSEPGGGDGRPFLFYGELSFVTGLKETWSETLRDIAEASQ
jgi:hypothetical protein